MWKRRLASVPQGLWQWLAGVAIRHARWWQAWGGGAPMVEPPTPTTGNKVIYRQAPSDGQPAEGFEYPAVVTRVWDDLVVNLLVCPESETPHTERLVRCGPGIGEWRWPDPP